MELTPLERFIIDNLLKGGSSVYLSHRQEIVVTFKRVADGEETAMSFHIPALTQYVHWTIHRFLERIPLADKREFVVTEVRLDWRDVVGSWKEGEDWEAFIAPIRDKVVAPF